jgi:mRNA-degrading endonuclease toxin of MazEF toxin-antitoxin module
MDSRWSRAKASTLQRSAFSDEGVLMSELPERGALVWVDFTPQSGHEQAGHRPALVMSPFIYHERSKLAVVCPITSNPRPWPWKVMLPDGLAVSGAVLVDQLRAIDRAARRLRLAGVAPQSVVAEVQAKLAALFGIVS